jgi:putative ABC transport system permease protein
MKILRQISAVTGINLGSIPQRWGASLVVVAGIAGVVGVLVSILALGQAYEHTLTATGRADRAVITSKGAWNESGSALSRDTIVAIEDAPGIRKNAQGKPILSMEVLTQIPAHALSDDMVKNVSLRGIGPQAMALRPEIHLVQGRMFRPGLHELVVGVPLQSQFKDMAVGDQLSFRDSPWTIVGSFATSGGSGHDSEIFGDAPTLMSTFHRITYQSITVQLTSSAALKILNKAIAANPSLSVDVHPEDQYFAQQSQGLTKLLNMVGYFIGGIMAVGAVFAALNTMYAAVSAQSLQIATLRAIGFNAGAVLVAVFLEALLLALAGALLGTAVAWLLFSGHSLNMVAGSQAQMVFTLHVTPQLAVLGIVWALVIGFLGGIFPAIRAARLPVATALRAT